MASAPWSTWVKWNGSVEQTLLDGQHLAAGEGTIADARKRAAKAGGGSILTVDTVSDRPFLGRCWVLSGEELHQHFGSRTPPKKAIEAGQASFLEKLEPGQSVAIIAYGRGVAAAVLFGGRG